jgi:hypothetical protein
MKKCQATSLSIYIKQSYHHFTYRPTSFCVYLKCNSPNIYWSKKRFEQKLQRKLNAHFMFNTLFPKSSGFKDIKKWDTMHTFQNPYIKQSRISLIICVLRLFIHLFPFFWVNNWEYTVAQWHTTTSFALQYHSAVIKLHCQDTFIKK